MQIGPECSLVIVEGMLLLHPEGKFAVIRDQLDMCIYLDVELNESRERGKKKKRPILIQSF